jgi:2C-methyl-D-erythritol 2,4-cyclodiphosphate synthase
VEAMREAIAQLLGLDSEQVSVKLSTGNLQGPEGEGRAISAHAVALLVPLAPASGQGA